MLNNKPILIRRLLLSLTLFISLFIASNNAKAGAADGEKIFNTNCARCHILGRRSTGPNLVGVSTRWSDTTKLYAWIHNPPAILATGDTYTNGLLKDYGTVMQAFPNLSNQDIANVLSYIKAYVPPAETASGGGGETSEAKDNTTLYIIIIAGLLLIAIVLARVVKNLNRMVGQKYGDSKDDLVWYKKKSYRPVVVIICLILFCILSFRMYDSATALGRQEGYQPDQPIAFSHKIHAGINKIDCKYCHVGAERGKSAVIPSLSICMNCHYNIQAMSDGTEGYSPAKYTPEIQKIFQYTGFNKETLKYDKPATPVKWVKIHNLPDHVYFNHSQHVKVAGLECQTCHGPVEQMDVVKQQENLSMGWCINCHRNTDVHFTDNDFYKSYADLHEKLDNGEIKEVKAADIGATECQRCHY